MANTFPRTSTYAVLAMAGGVAALASIAGQAGEPTLRVRHGMAPAPQVTALTRIEVDSQEHAIRFYINGEQIAKLDSLGLQESIPAR
jgi:hypothetical protein